MPLKAVGTFVVTCSRSAPPDTAKPVPSSAGPSTVTRRAVAPAALRTNMLLLLAGVASIVRSETTVPAWSTTSAAEAGPACTWVAPSPPPVVDAMSLAGGTAGGAARGGGGAGARSGPGLAGGAGGAP